MDASDTSSLAGLRPGLLYRSEDYFPPIGLDFEAMAERAAASGWAHPKIRCAMNGYDLHPMHYTRFVRSFEADPLSQTATTRWDALSQIYKDGAVVIFDDLERLSEEADAACRKVLADLRRKAQCNGYFSNGKHFGFKKHSDVNDIVVYQGLGRKTWFVTLDGREIAFDMAPGDLMLVPKHIDHWVRPESGAASAHLSITIDNV